MNADVFMTAVEVAHILGVHPQALRNQAHTNPSALGFPVIVVGSRVLVPRKPFVNFIEEGGENHDDDRGN